MRTILKDGVFYEVCPRCGLGGHCYLSGGNPRRCPHRYDHKTDAICKIRGLHGLPVLEEDEHGPRS